jgi:putative sigma-54 modulation protein
VTAAGAEPRRSHAPLTTLAGRQRTCGFKPDRDRLGQAESSGPRSTLATATNKCPQDFQPPIAHAAVCPRMATANFSDDLSKIHMQGIHIELTAALQNAIREKFSVLLRHNGWIVRINVRLHQDQRRGQKAYFTATGQIEVRGPDIVASVKGDDAYNVLDGLAAKLSEQLRERHERFKDKRNHPHDIELDAELPKVRD